MDNLLQLLPTDKMDAIAIAIRTRLEEIGATEELIAKFFEGGVVPEKKVRKGKSKKVEEKVEIVKVEEGSGAAAGAGGQPAEPEKPAEPVSDNEGKEKTRSRTVSKKMKEAFIALAGSDEKLEECCKAYKVASEEDIQSKGGNFDGFSRAFLGLEQPEPKAEKKTKAKKEKAPSRISKWTPTLTRQLIKIVEESGGKMEDQIKTDFHAWIDAMTEETFATAAMEGHMRAFVLQKLAPQPEAKAQAEVPVLAEDDEEMEEIEHEGETLWVGLSTGKIHRETPEGGYLWIGTAGVKPYENVKKPSA